jgi:hypothetical protein
MIVGRATFTMLLSMVAIKTPIATREKETHGRERVGCGIRTGERIR